MTDAPAAPAAETQPPTQPAPTPEPQPGIPAPGIPPTTGDRKDPPPQNVVAEATRRQKAAEKEAAAFKARIEELEDKDRTELERAIKRAEKAEQKATEVEANAKKMERASWIVAAAQQAGFADPGDAAAFLDLETVENPEVAAAQVADLAERKPHLRGQAVGPQPGGGGIGSVIGPAPLGGTPPLGPDGQPDVRAGIGRDLLAHLSGGSRRR